MVFLKLLIYGAFQIFLFYTWKVSEEIHFFLKLGIGSQRSNTACGMTLQVVKKLFLKLYLIFRRDWLSATFSTFYTNL